MSDLGCMLVESRPFVVLDRLPGLYGLKYDSATASGLLLYLCSYKLDISPISGNQYVPAGLAVVAAQAPVFYSGLGVLLVAWWGSPSGAWWHWRPHDQVYATAEVACSRAMPVRRTKIRVPSSVIIELHFLYTIK